MTPQPLYYRRGRKPHGENVIKVDSTSLWRSPYTIGCSGGFWYVKHDGVKKSGYFADSDLAVAEALRLYEAFVKEKLRLSPDWLDPLRESDYLSDEWAGDGPASVLCKILAEAK